MRLLCLSLALSLFTGCVSKFDGEWVENRVPSDGESIISGEPRMAISFEGPSLVRMGLVVEEMQVVDENSVQQSGYFLFDGWDKAQFGHMQAKVQGDEMVAVTGRTERRFVRVKGKSIFPPRMVLYPWG